ncbi:MAG: hypothetical protein ACK53L_29380, partial [Pirellulaceae bacterium]
IRSADLRPQRSVRAAVGDDGRAEPLSLEAFAENLGCDHHSQSLKALVASHVPGYRGFEILF